MAKGPDDFADAIVNDKVSVSRYPLSASVVCGKVRWAARRSVRCSECLITQWMFYRCVVLWRTSAGYYRYFTSLASPVARTEATCGVT